MVTDGERCRVVDVDRLDRGDDPAGLFGSVLLLHDTHFHWLKPLAEGRQLFVLRSRIFLQPVGGRRARAIGLPGRGQGEVVVLGRVAERSGLGPRRTAMGLFPFLLGPVFDALGLQPQAAPPLGRFLPKAQVLGHAPAQLWRIQRAASVVVVLQRSHRRQGGFANHFPIGVRELDEALRRRVENVNDRQIFRIVADLERRVFVAIGDPDRVEFLVVPYVLPLSSTPRRPMWRVSRPGSMIVSMSFNIDGRRIGCSATSLRQISIGLAFRTFCQR